MENAQGYAWPNVVVGGVWTHPLPMQVYVLPDGARVFVPPNYGGLAPQYASMYCAERLPPGMCEFDWKLYCARNTCSFRPNTIPDNAVGTTVDTAVLGVGARLR